MLAWALKAHLATVGTVPADLEQWGLANLIAHGVKLGLIGKNAEAASWAVKHFRNFIHPSVAVRQGSSRADHALAVGALSAVREITRSLRNRLAGAADPALPPSEELVSSLFFAWLLPDRLAGCRGPVNDADLAALRLLGIEVVIRLAAVDEANVSAEQVGAAGLTDLHVPVEDFHAPTREQVERLVALTERALGEGRAVAVCCGAGYGRTSTALACILIHRGMSVGEAAAEIQKRCRRGPEVTAQWALLEEYAGQVRRH